MKEQKVVPLNFIPKKAKNDIDLKQVLDRVERYKKIIEESFMSDPYLVIYSHRVNYRSCELELTSLDLASGFFYMEA